MNRAFTGVLGVLVVFSTFIYTGCEPAQRTIPPLLTAMPTYETPQAPRRLDVPTPPDASFSPIVIRIPGKNMGVTSENSVMRKGSAVKSGSSVVISVPASVANRSQDEVSHNVSDSLGFRTDGYFNVLEQYIERGLLAVGLQAKDRSKFEAKLRDVRDSGKTVRASDDSYSIALASLERDLASKTITREEFAEKAKQLRDKLLDPAAGSRNREELTDISEVIRAAQSGDVMADYVLQVNELSVKAYSGAPLQLAARPEVQSALAINPGLRVGGEPGKSVPSLLPQPWAQARFNAKLIDVKTGSIDWIGDYSIESLSVLDDGLIISIGVRRRTSNGKMITDAIHLYNNNVQAAYERAVAAEAALKKAYTAAMQPLRYTGTSEQGEFLQSDRRREVERAEKDYATKLTTYREIARAVPLEARAEWVYEYDIDSPTVTPDLLNPKTEEEQRRLLDHVKALGFKVTHDLLTTISVGQ